MHCLRFHLHQFEQFTRRKKIRKSLLLYGFIICKQRFDSSLKEKFTQWPVECTWLSRGSYHRSFTGTRIIRFAKFTSRLVKIATIYSYTRLLRSRLELRLRLMLGSRLESGSSLTSHFAILARVLPYQLAFQLAFCHFSLYFAVLARILLFKLVFWCFSSSVGGGRWEKASIIKSGQKLKYDFFFIRQFLADLWPILVSPTFLS